MGEDDEDNCPQQWFDGVGGELLEIILHISCIAIKLTQQRRKQVLHAPASNDGIEAEDNDRRKHAHVTDDAPYLAADQRIGPGRIGCAMTTHHKLGNHAGNAQHGNGHQIDHNKGGATVLTGDIGKTPDITKAYRRACGSQHNAYLCSKTATLHSHNDLNDAELVHEDTKDGDGGHEAHQKEIGLEEMLAHRAPVGKLVFHQLLRHTPA